MSFDTKDPFAQTYQIALCQDIQHGWLTVWQMTNGRVPSSYVRLSEPVTVQFQKVGTEEGIQEALKAIDDLERTARNELNRKLSDFADRRASLLALTHDKEAV